MSILVPAYNSYIRLKAAARGYSIKSADGYFRISRDKREIRLAHAQAIYLGDTLDHFDFYYDGVEPETIDGLAVVDYSSPKWHRVKGFDAFPVFFPAVAEPIVTTHQYIEFAKLGAGAVAIDLGAYSGLTSILFDMAIPSEGRVIAVEADPQNIVACEKNFAVYKERSNRTLDLVKAAIWKNSDGVSFSSEGSMGSSVLSVVGSGRGKSTKTPSITLEDLVRKFELQRVDFIKCDIEGGETEVFDRPEFFARFSPRIMIECHEVGGVMTSIACEAILKKFGYTCELVTQQGYPLPLLTCVRGPTD